MKVAVVGAGWAGAAAAYRLQQAGHQVTVFEASRHLGGRARSNYSPKLNLTVDNGQHILLGAYSAILTLMQSLGLDLSQRLLRDDLSIRCADHSLVLRTAALPAPWHLLWGVLNAQGLTLREKWQLLRICTQLRYQQWQVPVGQTVQQWLRQGKQSDRLVRIFWQPLCVAAMNTPIDIACAQLFAHVLRDSLGATRQASQSLIPLCGLSELWCQHALAQTDLRLGTRVNTIKQETNGTYLLNEDTYHAVIACAQAPHTASLLQDLPPALGSVELLQSMQAMQHIPIATVYLELEAPWCLPHPMWLLQEDPQGLAAGQWLFDHSCLHPESTLLAVVISDAGRLQHTAKDTIIDAVIAQIATQTAQWAPPMPSVRGSELIMEKRASFAATPGLQRPDNRSPWPGLYLAGDWTDTGYPGVLEGAVRSGLRAADLCLQDYKKETCPVTHC